MGFGAYTAALFAKHIHPDPLLGLLVGTACATVLGAVCSFSIMRGTDLTRLMVTLGTALILLELANKWDDLTGGADGGNASVVCTQGGSSADSVVDGEGITSNSRAGEGVDEVGLS